MVTRRLVALLVGCVALLSLGLAVFPELGAARPTARQTTGLTSLLSTTVPMTVSVRPATVKTGGQVTIAGSGWVLFESCKPTVTLSIIGTGRSIGPVALRTGGPRGTGIFSLRWRVPAKLHGKQTLDARQRCENGNTGKTYYLTTKTSFEVA